MASGHGQAIASWWRDDPPAPAAAAALLTGLSVLYRGARALHRGLYAAGLKRRRRLPIPVVSVGNVTVGGTGKTPFVAWLARELIRRERRVLVLARGFGRAAGASHNDEGEWLDRAAPGVRVVQSPDRVRAAAAALSAAPADVAILDDGFQHEPLARDLDVVLIDASDPFGNRRLLPRGPLREPLAALRRAQFVFLTRAELASEADVERLAAEVRALAPAARVGTVRFEIASLRKGADREAVVVGASGVDVPGMARPRRVV